MYPINDFLLKPVVVTLYINRGFYLCKVIKTISFTYIDIVLNDNDLRVLYNI